MTKGIGKIIKKNRLELNLTLDDVAKAVGVSKSTVQRWESGQINNMRRDRIDSLSKILQISPLIFVDANEDNHKKDSPAPNYYLDPETAEMAEELHKRKDMRMLFHAAKSSTPEDVKMVTDMLERFKNS